MSEERALKETLAAARDEKGPVFIEIKAAIGAREELGRLTKTPVENKKAFMEHLRGG